MKLYNNGYWVYRPFCRGRFLQVILFKTIYFELNLFAEDGGRIF